MNQHFKRLLHLTAVLILGLTSCNSDTSTTVKEKEEIQAMDSTTIKVEANTKKLEEQTKKLEESIEKVDKEFTSNQ